MSNLFPACSGLRILLLLAAACGTLSAQQTNPAAAAPAPAPGTTLRVSARLVVLDVVATDASHQPVDDLKSADFHVFEQGKLQSIRSFEPPSGHRLPETTAAAGLTAAFDPASPASFGRSPVNVLVLDQLNTHFADSAFARGALKDFLLKQPALLPQPTTLLALADNKFHILQPFTRDRDALLHALAAAPVKYAWQLEVNGQAAYGPLTRLDQSLRALEQIAQAYAAIPGRKNLVWVGGGFPTLDPTSIDGNEAKEVTDTLRHITGVLLDTRTTLNAVDPTSTAAGMTEITTREQTEFAQLAGDSLSVNLDVADPNNEFDKLGAVTGGTVLRGRNDVGREIGQVIEQGDHYYTIAYAPDSSSAQSAAFRNIKVECLRPGITVATRTGYFNTTTQPANSAANASYDLSTAADSTAQLNGLHVRVERDSTDTTDSNHFVVHVDASGLNWQPGDDGGLKAHVYVMAVAFNAKNKQLGHTLRGMAANARPGTNPREPGKDAAFAFDADPHPGSARMRFVVRDSANGLMGSFELPLKP